ncbi:hypothetical protein BDV24DRAFT_170382 [Aspergillus arachidicola]|uniref:Uncharacterized protein n=1 Tax=Aspergillus arachidicola TaxID=656916 RepID=A0A5N6XLW4_9EURO|nr:hypothetical protein BDV24DRAFT_170382 [Aspergillus arachidicola]
MLYSLIAAALVAAAQALPETLATGNMPPQWLYDSALGRYTLGNVANMQYKATDKRSPSWSYWLNEREHIERFLHDMANTLPQNLQSQFIDRFQLQGARDDRGILSPYFGDMKTMKQINNADLENELQKARDEVLSNE